MGGSELNSKDVFLSTDLPAGTNNDTKREQCSSIGVSAPHHSDADNLKVPAAPDDHGHTATPTMKSRFNERMTDGLEWAMGLQRRAALAHYSHFQKVSKLEKLYGGLKELQAPILLICFILAYISIFALIFSWLEDCAYYPDSYYWAVVTLFTIGFGDVVPLISAMRALTVFYVLFGITAIVSAISVVLESLKTVRLQFRSAERRNVKVLAARAAENALSPQTSDNFAPVMLIQKEDDFDLLVEEFTIKRVFRKRIASLLKSIIAAILITAIGALGYWLLERHDAVVSIYLAVVTLSTVGYGDIPIKNNSTKAFVILFTLIALPVYTACLSTMMTTISQMFELRRIKHWTAEGVTQEMIMEADKNGNGTVDRTEFTLYYLEKLGRIDNDDLRLIRSLFDKYDRDGSGTLDINDFCPENEKNSTK